MSDITVTWATKIINIPKDYLGVVQLNPTEIREMDLNAFRLDLKGLEGGEEGVPFLDTHRHILPVTVGGVELARVVEIINGYTVTFEDGQYAVNLFGANSNVADVTNVNQVSVRAANSAGLVSSADIEYGSFGGGVHLDVINGVSGTTPPTGTPRQKSNNLVDTLLIATRRGFGKIFVYGDFTFESGDDITDYIVVGQNAHLSTLTFESGCVTDGAEFQYATLQGITSGEICTDHCMIGDLSAKGCIEYSFLLGTLTLLDGGSVTIMADCRSAVPGMTTPVVDFVGAGRSLSVRAYSGGLDIRNMTDASNKLTAEFVAGQCIMDGSCIAGIAAIRGITMVTDNSGPGCTVNREAQLQTTPMAYAGEVWIDTVSGAAGTQYPAGTQSYPVDNITDAKTIADLYNIYCYRIIGNITLNDNFDGVTFGSHKASQSVITLNNQSTNGASFEHVGLTGQCNGSIHCHHCELDSIQNIEGVFMDCALSDGFSVKSGGKAYFFRAFSHDLAPMSFDMNGDGTLVYYGTAWITVTDLTDAAGLCACSGDIGLTIDSTVTDGNIYITGDTVVNADNKTGGNVVYDYNNAHKIWEVARSVHTNAGTFGAVSEWAGAINQTAIREAVWNASKNDYNDPDTMGELQNTGGSGGGLDADAVASAVWDAIANQYGTPGTMGWLQNLIQAGLISSPRIIPGD